MEKCKIWNKAVDIALIAGVVILALKGVDGWGWLIAVLIIKNS
jgi:hypothetical protein